MVGAAEVDPLQAVLPQAVGEEQDEQLEWQSH